MKRILSRVLPIPVEEDIEMMLREGVTQTGLVKADIMRHGLRQGVPMVVRQMKTNRNRIRPACLDYLDEYPRSLVEAKDTKSFLKDKLARKYGSHR